MNAPATDDSAPCAPPTATWTRTAVVAGAAATLVVVAAIAWHVRMRQGAAPPPAPVAGGLPTRTSSRGAAAVEAPGDPRDTVDATDQAAPASSEERVPRMPPAAREAAAPAAVTAPSARPVAGATDARQGDAGLGGGAEPRPQAAPSATAAVPEPASAPAASDVATRGPRTDPAPTRDHPDTPPPPDSPPAEAHDQPFDDQPPASVDSPDVRRAWLARIRELVDEEQYDAARASAAEFRRRHPGTELPDDLGRLLR